MSSLNIDSVFKYKFNEFKLLLLTKSLDEFLYLNLLNFKGRHKIDKAGFI